MVELVGIGQVLDRAAERWGDREALWFEGQWWLAFVIPVAGRQLTEREVIDFCRGRIASFKIPSRVYFVDQFPLTGSGKIQKYLLRTEAERLFAADVSEPSRLVPTDSLVGRS